MIFSFFKKKSKIDRLVAEIPKVMAAYGSLLERHPMVVLDITMLPLPKPEMKKTLKIAWTLAVDEQSRRAAEYGYMQLAQFQDGVGKEPINVPKAHNPWDDPHMKKVVVSLDRHIAWSKKVNSEMAELLVEFESFKRTQS